MVSIAENREHWALLIRRVRNICNRTQQAEDLLQSAFVKMEEYRSSTEIKNEAAFLVTTATNIWIDDCRKRKRETLVGEYKTCHDIGDLSPLQDEVLASRERLERVREGLKIMPPRSREIFLMHRLDGMKYREIAATLKITQSAVEKNIARAQQFLTDYIDSW